MSAFKNVSRPPVFSKDCTFVSDANSLPRSAILNRQQYTQSTRVRKILLANKNSLNNAIEIYNSNINNINNNNNINNETLSTKSSSNQNSLSFDLANQSLNDLSLIKKPFKHYKQSSVSTKVTSRSISVVSNERINNNNNNHINSHANLKTPQTNRTNQNISSNPSSTMILKTAGVLNDFVDYFEKYRNQNQTVQVVNLKPKRSSKYSGLKPLLNSVDRFGPNIVNCMGIIKEPKSKRNQKLKDIYDQKLKLLEDKQNEANLSNNLEENIIYNNHEQTSLKRYKIAENE